MSVAAAFASALAGLTPAEDHDAIGVAVSGGGDSMALLHLAAGWGAAQGFAVHAVTVDHRLRTGAAAEAVQVAAVCAGLGVSHETLHWQGWDGRGNLQDAARQARRRLIGEWATGRGIDIVLLGHTADDQAETVLMRLARGSGVDGLAGMSGAHFQDRVQWQRPLLALRREALRNWLRGEGIGWTEDPSNDDRRYDRIKARQMLGALADLGLTVDRLLRTAAHMQAAQVSLRQAAADFAALHVVQADGDLLLTPAGFELDAGDSPGRVLAAALGWIGGADYRPRYQSLRDFAEKVRAGQGATLAGCMAQVQADGRVRLHREPGAVEADVLTHRPADTIVCWDHRWAVSLRPPAPSRVPPPIPTGLRIGALGDTGLKSCPDWRTTGLPRTSLLSSPAVWQGETLIAAPLAGFNDAWQARIVADFHASLLSH